MASEGLPQVKLTVTYRVPSSPFKPHYACTFMLESELEWDRFVKVYTWLQRPEGNRPQELVGTTYFGRLGMLDLENVLSVNRPARKGGV